MRSSWQPSRVLFAAAMTGLGITGLVNGDFALAWQPIPLHHMPGRTLIAYLCAVIELTCGLGMLWNSTAKAACRLLLPYMLLWVGLLEIPVVVNRPTASGSWGTLGEIVIITAGACTLFARHGGGWERRCERSTVESAGELTARMLLVMALPMIGLQVILEGATYGLPPWISWLPHPTWWVYLSGLGSLAACIGLLVGLWPRLAATLEAVMLAVVTVWFWGPYLHTGRTATTAFLISFLIVAGVWSVADTYSDVPWLARTGPIWRPSPVSSRPRSD